MESTAIISFSKTQIMLLSKEAANTISCAALGISAVSSTTTGGFPGPAAMTRFPDFIAARTTPPPPVTTSSLIPRFSISSPADSTVGSQIVVITLGGPPSEMIAWLIRYTA